MSELLNRASCKRLLAYSAAAGLGAFAFGQPAHGVVVIGDLSLDAAWDPIAHPLPPTGSVGDDITEINWDAGQPFDLQTPGNPLGIDHIIIARKFDNTFKPWCDQANYPGCQGDTPGAQGVTSTVFSAQTYLDSSTHELSGNAALVDPNGPNAAFYSLEWVNNTYYTVGFGPGVMIDGTSKIVGTINNASDHYGGFATAVGSLGTANAPGLPNPDRNALTHTIAGDFIAFSFEGTDGTHYGWAQIGLQVGPSQNMKVAYHRYAYETTPDTPIATPIVGDLNMDGFVGIEDLNKVLASWNQVVPEGDWRLGDIAGWVQPVDSGRSSGVSGGDGFVGIEDLNAVLGNWNTGAPPTVGVVIPEPASLALLAIGSGAIALRRRRV